MLNGTAVHELEMFDQELAGLWLILGNMPGKEMFWCGDVEEGSLYLSGKEKVSVWCDGQNGETKVIRESEIPVCEIPICDIKACVVHLWKSCQHKKWLVSQNATHNTMGINTKDSEAEVAFSDTAAELNL